MEEYELHQTVQPTTPGTPASYFDGTTWQLIGWRLLGWLLSIVTLGIGAAWAQCMVIRWETMHTVVDGQRLRFDGKGHQLLGKYLLWGLLTVITLGIYTLFLPVRMEKWRTSHTRIMSPEDPRQQSSPGIAILICVLAAIPFLALLLGCSYFMADEWDELKDTILQGKWGQQETSSIPNGSIYIPVQTQPVETEPSYWEPTTADGIRLPRPDDDEDFWYVHNSDEGLNLRRGPGVEYDVIRNMPHGTEINVLEWENGWAFTGEGWCAGNDLRINPPKDVKPSTEQTKSIVGYWGHIQKSSYEWYGDTYYVVLLRFYDDGTFFSQTASVNYEEIGGSWVWFPNGLESNSEFRGTYTYKNNTLQLNYEDGLTVKTSASWNGKQMKLGDPKGIRTHQDGRSATKVYTTLIPLKDDLDLYYELPHIVRDNVT